MNNLLDALDDLIKAGEEGEGSRGGKIVGHTSGGKPIYSSAGNRNHKGFTKKEHNEAYHVHSRIRSNLNEERHETANSDGTVSKQQIKKRAQLQKQIEHHHNQAQRHQAISEGDEGSPDQKDFDRMDRQNDPQHRSRAWGRGETMNNDIFKSLGISIGELNLIETTKETDALSNVIKSGRFELGRPGSQTSLRENLYKSLGATEEDVNKGLMILLMPKGKPKQHAASEVGENPKDQHAESFHPDASKDLIGEAEEVDRIHDTEEDEYPAVRYMAASSVKERKSLADYLDDLTKAVKPLKPGAKPRKDPDPMAAKLKRQRMKELGIKKAAPEGVDPEKHERCVKKVKAQGHDVGSAHAICTSSMKSELDELVDLIKGCSPAKKAAYKGGPGSGTQGHTTSVGGRNMAAPGARVYEMRGGGHVGEFAGKKTPEEHRKEYEAKMANWKKENSKMQLSERLPNFIKASGSGGILFDFGNKTGNPIADNATALLQSCSDPVQEQIAQYQADSYAKSLKDYVSKGDDKFRQENPTSQETAPIAPPEFKKAQLAVGGELVEAKSETDAAVIELMKNMVEAQSDKGGFTAAPISITAGE